MVFYRDLKGQSWLLPPDIRDMIPQEHICRLVDMVMDGLDLSDLESSYEGPGHPAYHPKMMLKILVMATIDGVRSSRKIARLTRENVVYMFLAGLLKPDFRTISDFRKNHPLEVGMAFREVVLFAKSLGMVRLGHVSIDGTKVKANASNYRVIKKKELGEIERFIEEELRRGAEEDEREDRLYGSDKTGYELLGAVGEKGIVSKIKERFRKGDGGERMRLAETVEKAMGELEQGERDVVSLTDPESRFMKNKRRFELSYNAQVTVDSYGGIIIANDVVQDIDDSGQLVPQIEQAGENLCEDLSGVEVSADNGYYSVGNLLYLRGRGMDGYIPDDDLAMEMKEKGKTRKEDIYPKRLFRYDMEGDLFICPEGNSLTFRFEYFDKSRGHVSRIYRCDAGVCMRCPSMGRCTKSRRGRIIKSPGHEALRMKMAEKMRSEEGKEKYRLRAQTVEAPIGDIKQNQGLREFLTRGVESVKTEFNLACTAYNLKRIWNHMKEEGVWKEGVGAVKGAVLSLKGL